MLEEQHPLISLSINKMEDALQTLGWGCIELDASGRGAWIVRVEEEQIRCLICPVLERQYVFVAALVGEVDRFRPDWMSLCLASHFMGLATGIGSFGTTADQRGLLIGRTVTSAELASRNLERYLPELVAMAIHWRQQLISNVTDVSR
jgi:hypothetical protein